MELKKIGYDLTICKVEAVTDIDMAGDFYPLARVPRPLFNGRG